MLKVQDLEVTLHAGKVCRAIIRDVGFSLTGGQVLAVVGESGSGKTTLCRALTKLFPASSNVNVSGVVEFKATSLLAKSELQLQEIRRQKIRYVFQEPQQALNPVATICNQMILAASNTKPDEHILIEALQSVGLMNAHEILGFYPHQLSIGMAQRVMIAIALLPKPELLIADEPTSAVDASLRFQLLNLLRSLQQQFQMAMLLVTHDLNVARKYADHVAVMFEGKIVESATCSDFFRGPQHPYSQSLLNAIPILTRNFQTSNR